MRRTRAVLLCLLAGTFACDGEERGPTQLSVQFVSQADGRPIAGVHVLADSRPIGATGEDGRLSVTLRGPEGAVIDLAARCPEGYRSPEDLPELLLRPIADVEGDESRSVRIDLECAPERRDGVVVVRAAERAGIPVLLDGREIARTDGHGIAHFAVRMAPHTTFKVQLATAHLPRLRPQEPSRTFTVPDSEEIFVFDQQFEEERPPRRRRRRPPRREPVRLPMRLGGN